MPVHPRPSRPRRRFRPTPHVEADLEALRHRSLFRASVERIIDRDGPQYRYLHGKAGDVLFREGDRIDGLYIVTQGYLSLTKGSGATLAYHGTVESGQCLGEYELLTGTSKEFLVSAVAIGDARVALVPRFGVERFLKQARHETHGSVILSMAIDIATKAARTSNLRSRRLGAAMCLYLEALLSLTEEGHVGVETCRDHVRRRHPLTDEELRDAENRLLRRLVIKPRPHSFGERWIVRMDDVRLLLDCSLG